MVIRDFKPQDAACLAQIFHDSIHEIAGKDYSPEQLAAWSPQIASVETVLSRVSDGRSVFVAIDANETPMAYIELGEAGYIDQFYC